MYVLRTNKDYNYIHENMDDKMWGSDFNPEGPGMTNKIEHAIKFKYYLSAKFHSVRLSILNRKHGFKSYVRYIPN